MNPGKSEKGMIRLLQHLLHNAVAAQETVEEDEGEKVSHTVNSRKKKSGLRTYFEARCEAFLEEKGNYYVPIKQYLPFMINGVMHNGKEHPLVSGDYKSLDQLMNFHLAVQKYGFDVEPKWSHNIDSSIELDNPFQENGKKLRVANVYYWRRLRDSLNEPMFLTQEQIFEQSGKFKVGDRVLAKWKRGRTKYLGTITKVHNDGEKYSIDYDDGDKWDACRPSMMEAVKDIAKDSRKSDKKLSSSLVSVEGERFVLKPGGKQTLSFGHVDQLLEIQKLLQTPAVKEDFSLFQNFQPDGKFTVGSGTYKSLVDYNNFLARARTENIAVVKNHTLEGGFELTIGQTQGVFKDWEDYRTLYNHMCDLVKGTVKRSLDGSISVNSTLKEVVEAPTTVSWQNSYFKDLETFDSFRRDCLREGISRVTRVSEDTPFFLEFRGKVWEDSPERVMSIKGRFQSFQEFRSFKNNCASLHIRNIINHITPDGAFEVAMTGDQHGGWFKDMQQYEQLCSEINAIQNELESGKVCGHKPEDRSFWVTLPGKGEDNRTDISDEKQVNNDEKEETEVALTTKISGYFKNTEEFLAFKWVCRNSNIPIASHKNPNEFTTPQGTFKSVKQYQALHAHLTESVIQKVYGHTTAGRFRLSEDFAYIVREGTSADGTAVPTWEDATTKHIYSNAPRDRWIKPLWHCTKKSDGSGFNYTSFSDKKEVNSMPEEFQYPAANFTVRYDRWANTMFWINNETGETYNETPPNWDGPKVEPRAEMKWERPISRPWWGLVRSQLKNLSAAEVLGMNILDTQLSKNCQLCLNIAAFIASFLVSEERVLEFKVGERVRAKWQQGNEWYNGNIKEINEDGETFAVQYEDGDFWENCPRSMIQAIAPLPGVGEMIVLAGSSETNDL